MKFTTYKYIYKFADFKSACYPDPPPPIALRRTNGVIQNPDLPRKRDHRRITKSVGTGNSGHVASGSEARQRRNTDTYPSADGGVDQYNLTFPTMTEKPIPPPRAI